MAALRTVGFVVSLLFLFSMESFSEPPEKSEKNEKQTSKETDLDLKEKIRLQQEKEKKIQLKIRKLKKEHQEKDQYTPPSFSSAYRRLFVNNKTFWTTPGWIETGVQMAFNVNTTLLKADPLPAKIPVIILEMSSRESRIANLLRISPGIYRGTFDFSKFPGNEFYIFFTYQKKGIHRTLFFKLTSSEEMYRLDSREVKKADKMLSILIAVRAEIEKKRRNEELARVRAEMEELKNARSEKIALENKLKAEMELLHRKRFEEERIIKMKEAERKRQLYEQRLAEERKRILKTKKARILAMRKRKLEMMERHKSAQLRKSKILVSKGQEAIINGEYEEAISFFDRARKLNPLNTDAYFYTGVALYYLDKRAESLKILLQIEEENPAYTEIYYYLGSLYFKDKKYGAAVVNFNASIEKKVKIYDSRFFLAMSLYKMEEYEKSLRYFKLLAKSEEAKKETSYLFEALCHYKMKSYNRAIPIFEKLYFESEDEAVAEQAEKFLKKARAMKKFEKRKTKWFAADLTLGVSQNSNVTNAASSADTPSSGKASAGTTANLSFSYLPLYNETWDSGLSFNFSDIGYTNSEVSSFESRSFGGSAMLKYKSVYKMEDPKNPEKPKDYIYSLSTTLEYSRTYMDFDSESGKELYSEKKSLTPSLMVILGQNHIGSLSLPMGMDDSYSDNDRDTRFGGLTYSHVYFLTKEKDKNLSGTGSFSVFSAAGDDESYLQASVAGAYSQPLPYSARGTGSLNLVLKSYGSHSEGRSDKAAMANINLSRDLYKDYISTEIWFSYLKNNSSLEDYTYSGWSAGLNLVGTY